MELALKLEQELKLGQPSMHLLLLWLLIYLLTYRRDYEMRIMNMKDGCL